VNIKELHAYKAAWCRLAIREHREADGHPVLCAVCLEWENDYDRHMAAIEDINKGIREYGLYSKTRG
jgi:hypothetical protein